MVGQRSEMAAKLQSEILRLQHFCTTQSPVLDVELGSITHSLPNASFPLGAVHEFLSERVEDAVATNAFVVALLSMLTQHQGIVLWASASRILFPPALQLLGVQPDRFIFLDVKNEKEVLWVMDEALKCSALTAVIGEARDLSFNESRKLQLAVEQSQVTGFILRQGVKRVMPTACVSRWKITSLPSDPFEELPGIGFPKWKVELLRMRNGKPGVWEAEIRNGKLRISNQETSIHPDSYRDQYPESSNQHRLSSKIA